MANMELIKNLRDRTGAGMMDCKRALEANNDDIEKHATGYVNKVLLKVPKKQAVLLLKV